MHMSGSIGGISASALERRGVAMDLAERTAHPPAEWSAAWSVPQWSPAPRLVHGTAGAVALTGESPAQIFDRFSPARGAPAATFHVSPSGSDANAGTQASPFRSISRAVTAANAGGAPATIRVLAGLYPRFANPAYAGVTPGVDIAFIAYGGRVVTGAWDDIGTVPADATWPSTQAIANAGVDRVLDRTRMDADGFHPELTFVASAAACNRIPGSWAYEAGKAYIHRPDGAPATAANTWLLRKDAAVWAFSQPVNVFLGAADAISGFDTVGGSANAAFVYQPNMKPAAMKAVVVERSSFCYAGGAQTVPAGANGTRVANLHGLALFVGCDASNNTRDGFSGGHYANIGAKGHLVTMNCRAIRNGSREQAYNTSASCNAFTLHDDCVGADFAGRFERGGGGLVRNVGSSAAWMVGTRLAHDRGDWGVTVPSLVQMNDNARIWLDRVQLDAPTGTVPLYAGSAAAIHTRAMPPLRSLAAGSGVIAEW